MAAFLATVAAAKMVNKQSECVKVVLRCRPLSRKEVDEGRQRIVEMDQKTGQVRIKNPKGGSGEPPKTFSFDLVYDWNCTQKQVFEETALPIVNSSLNGYNGTVFAYGQTGTGKTHTMEGVPDDPELMGIIPSTFKAIFHHIEVSKDKDFLVRASFLEIYNEDIRDLLSKNSQNRLEVKETPDTGVYVKDLTNFVVKGVPELNNVLAVGKKNRSVGATLMNQDSSRSHSIFTITIECSTRISGQEAHIRVGKLNLVDLAGSERQSKTGATGDRLKEATKINLSLSALGNVISSLVDGKSGHIPYRDSKLTRLLQDSLGGNTKTVMVANMGPADYNFDETLSTLRYANRAKNIKNKPRINEDPKDAMLREFQEEIARLKAAIEGTGGIPGSGGGGGGGNVQVVEKVITKEMSAAKKKEIADRVRREMEEQVRADLEKEMFSKAKEEVDQEVERKLHAIQEQKVKEEKEKERMAREMEDATSEIERHKDMEEEERQKHEELMQKLKAMESKVLHGDENLLEKLDEQEEQQRQIEEQRIQRQEAEAEQRRKMEELEEKNLMQLEKFESVQEEVETNSKKIKKLWTKYMSSKSEINDLQEEFAAERADLLDDIRRLTRDIKLKNLILDCYIPPEELEKISRRAQFIEVDETWSIDRLQYAGNHVRVRQATELLRAAKENGQSMPPGLDFTEADLEYVGYDINGVPMDARMQQAIKQAFEQDGGKVYNVNETLSNVYFSYTDGVEGEEMGGPPKESASSRPKSARPKSARPKSSRPKTASKKKGDGAAEEAAPIGKLQDHVADLNDENDQAAFPKARGLVSDKNVRRSVAKS